MTALEKIQQIITTLETVAPEFNIMQLKLLVEIGNNPGITQKELMDKWGLASATINRHVMSLRVRLVKDNRGNPYKKGLDLVEARQDLYDLKSLGLYLNKKGKAVVKRLEHILT